MSLPKPRGKKAKANQLLSARRGATCNSVGRRGGRRLGGLLLRVSHTMVVNAYTEAAIIHEGDDISEEPIRQR